jgi:N utilization substance protein A
VAKIIINDIYPIIEEFIEEKGISRETVLQGLVDSLEFIYTNKFPQEEFEIEYDKKLNHITIKKKFLVVNKVEDERKQINLKKALLTKSDAILGEELFSDFDEPLNRNDIAKIRQTMHNKIRLIEIQLISKEFEIKKETIVNGTVHKIDRFGILVLVHGYNAFLPNSNQIPGEKYEVGGTIKALIKDINKEARNFEEIIILDRSSELFIQKLLELEIPEIFENIITIEKIARVVGYKTKLLVSSKNKLIDPVGSCVGVGGGRIKPILKELNNEKIDFIPFTEKKEQLVIDSLKPAKIHFVEIRDKKAYAYLDSMEKSIAIGKNGKNIWLAVQISGFSIELFDDRMTLKDHLQNTFHPKNNEEYQDDSDADFQDEKDFEEYDNSTENED